MSMLDVHDIEVVGGERRTLREWGFAGAVFEQRNDGTDALDLSAPLGPGAAAIFPPDTTIRLWDGDGIIRLVATVRRPRQGARAGKRWHRYTAEGLSWQLKEKMYRQTWKLASVNPTTGAVTYSEMLLTAVTLFRNVAGDARNVRQQIEAILEYAIAQGVSLTYSLDNLPTVQPQAQEELDLRIYDAIRAALEWCPEVSMGVDYSSGTPHVYFSRAATLDGVQLLGPETFSVRTVDLGELEDFEVDPREDLLCGTVRINYLRPLQVEVADGSKRAPLNVSVDESTVSNGSDAVLESTVRLAELQWTGSGFEPADDEPVDGLAASLHEGYARLAYSLRFSRPVHVMEWQQLPGELWNVTGADADLETAFSVCQSIVRDLGRGRMEFRCGLQTGLSLSGRLQLLRANRTRKRPTGQAGEQQYGFGASDKEAQTTEAGDLVTFYGTKLGGAKAAWVIRAREVPL